LSRRRVVITGLGIISPVGNSVSEAWANILAGNSGITKISRFDASRLSCQIAGEVKAFDLAQAYGSSFELAFLPARDALAVAVFAAGLGWLGALMSVSKYLR